MKPTSTPGSKPLAPTGYAGTLIEADLEAEQARAEALLREASVERRRAPGRADQLSETARSRLSLIAEERAVRRALTGRLSDGRTAADFAASLSGLSDAQLAGQARALEADGSPDAQLKQLAVEREQGRRAAVAHAERGASEQERLKGVKRQLKGQIEGAPPARIEALLGQESRSLQAAQGRLREATERLEAAPSAEAQAEVDAAARQVRTAYARRSVLRAALPAEVDAAAVQQFSASLKGLGPEQLQQRRAEAARRLEGLTTGAIRGDRDAIATQQRLVELADAAVGGPGGKPALGPVGPVDPALKPKGPGKVAPTVKPEGPADRHPTAGAPVWKGAGAFVWNAEAFPSDIAVEQLKKQGVKWVTLQITDGMTVNAQTERELARGYIDKLHKAGIQVGFWGVNRTEPEAEAKLNAELVKKWGADFYIANAEIEYKYTSGDGSPDPEAFGRSKRFIDAFRAELPDLPAGVSSYGRTDLADLDWKAWREAGFDWLPQTYLNDDAIYDPALSVEAAVKDGWPRDQVHPTIGIWGGGRGRVVSPQEYAESLRRSGATGFSTYLAETMSPEEWNALGAEIAKGDLDD